MKAWEGDETTLLEDIRAWENWLTAIVVLVLIGLVVGATR